MGFRVWAPNAQSVFVAGDFNGWSPAAHPLTSEGNGYWSTDVPGAQIGQRYKYVISGLPAWKNDPYAREMTHSAGDTIIHDPDFDWSSDDFVAPPWDEMVIYEMHIGTFNDTSSSGTGKFQDVINKLGYLRSLGINVIEVMASGEFPTDMSWGYNPAYIHAIESGYGGIKGFKEFIRAAHQHGIAVIFDVVYNHLGPDDLDMWRFDGWGENGKGGIYFYNDARSATPWGDTRPDYGRGEVRQYIRDNALMWLQKRHVDGLRWDATRFIHTVSGESGGSDVINDGWSLMQWINDEIKARQPWKISIAEDMHNNRMITNKTQDGGAGFDSQWDASFVNTIRKAVIATPDQQRDMFAVRDALYHRYNANAFSRVVYTESHDEVARGKFRVPEQIWPGNAASWYSKKRSTVGASIVFTAPGIPMIFQGQEFLEDKDFRDSVPLDWAKSGRYAGIVNLYRDLIKLRRNWFNNTRGLRGQHINVHHLNNPDKVIAYHRWENGGAGDDVIVVVNLGIRSYGTYGLGFPREGTWKVRFNSDWRGYSDDFGDHPSSDVSAVTGAMDGMDFQGQLSIGPYSVVILSQG